MSAHTDQTSKDDAEVIEMLKQLGREIVPPPGQDISGLLTHGRRARRHRRALVAPASGLAIVAIAALVFVTAHVRSNDNTRLFLAPAGLAEQKTQPPATQSDPNEQVLEQALGSDFSIDWESGQVTVRPGSPSAQGLPARLSVWTQIFALQQSPVSGELSEFCKPLVEKNVIFSACSSQVLPGGQTVYVQHSHTGPGGVKPGRSPDALASDGVRVLFEQPDGHMVIVDLSTQENESASTPDRRTAARAWLDDMTPRLMNAAIDPRVADTTGRRWGQPKPSASESAS